jgi:hypothetical protein
MVAKRFFTYPSLKIGAIAVRVKKMGSREGAKTRSLSFPLAEREFPAAPHGHERRRRRRTALLSLLCAFAPSRETMGLTGEAAGVADEAGHAGCAAASPR